VEFHKASCPWGKLQLKEFTIGEDSITAKILTIVKKFTSTKEGTGLRRRV
jgi:hypothetical protein